MCGIVGIVDSRNQIDEPLLLTCRDALRRRGPDAGGTWISPCRNVGLGHRRLSIIDLSAQANQPMMDRDGKTVLVYNGEVYNFRKLRQELESLGVAFHTRSDTEVVLNALRYWQEKALIRFHGQFALAFLDTDRRTLLLARDRMGEKPLYYFFNGDCFAFASELKALEKLPAFRKKLDETALADYLTYGYVLSPKSIWENVYKLEPGKFLRATFGDTLSLASPQPYWQLAVHPDPALTLEEGKEQFQTLLRSAAEEMTVADVPLGVFLSGGVDSSSVVAALAKQNVSANTFTIGFTEDSFNEAPYARRVADQYRTHHHEKFLSTDHVLDVFGLLADYLDEPFNDFSYLPTFYVTQEARKDVTVCLSGDGGDELFCGYAKYFKTKRLQRLNRIVPPGLRRFIARPLSAALPEHSDYKRQVHRLGFREDEFLFDMMALAFKPRELQRLAGPGLKRVLRDYEPASRVTDLLRECQGANLDLVNKLRFLDLKITLPEDMLVKVDRTSMANSLEVRPVYLHPTIVDFALRLPTPLLVQGTVGKFLPKRSLEDWLPRDLLYRPKMGFGIPLTKWFFGNLQDVLTRGLQGLPEEWFDRAGVDALLNNHLKGGRDFIMQIHNLVFLGTWLKLKGITN